MSEWQWQPLRSCQEYKEEYDDCNGWKARFHQLYVYGSESNCAQWYTDYCNCIEWQKNKSQSAKKALHDSETKRFEESTKFPAVWEKRSTPPADWTSVDPNPKSGFFTKWTDSMRTPYN